MCHCVKLDFNKKSKSKSQTRCECIVKNSIFVAKKLSRYEVQIGVNIFIELKRSIYKTEKGVLTVVAVPKTNPKSKDLIVRKTLFDAQMRLKFSCPSVRNPR